MTKMEGRREWGNRNLRRQIIRIQRKSQRQKGEKLFDTISWVKSSGICAERIIFSANVGRFPEVSLLNPVFDSTN